MHGDDCARAIQDVCLAPTQQAEQVLFDANLLPHRVADVYDKLDLCAGLVLDAGRVANADNSDTSILELRSRTLECGDLLAA